MYCKFATKTDIMSIIEIQMSNHKLSISKEDQKKFGFVTLLTQPSFLKKIMENKKSFSRIIVAKNDNKEVIGYLIAIMKEDCEFNLFMKDFVKEVDKLTSKKPDSTMYIAQIGVMRDFQRKGAGKMMYEYLFDYLDYTFERFNVASVITEVSNENIPSKKFHSGFNFKKIAKYQGPQGADFIIIEKKGRVRMTIK